MYLDTYNDLSWRLQAVQQYTHEDKNPGKIKLRISQKIVSPIMGVQINMKSKIFRNSSQSTAEFRKLWREFSRLFKNYWRQSLRRESRRRGGHIPASNACLVPNARIASQPKRGPHVLCQTQRLRSNLRHEPYSFCQTWWSCCSLRRRSQGRISTLKRESV